MGSQTETTYSIGEVARRSGVKIETIRFYERSGLLEPPPRTAGGHRMYSRAGVQRLIFIRRARELGFTLARVRELLAFADERGATCAEVERLARDHLAEVRSRIADLSRMDVVLSDLVTHCAGDTVPECPILEVLSDERDRPRTS